MTAPLRDPRPPRLVPARCWRRRGSRTRRRSWRRRVRRSVRDWVVDVRLFLTSMLAGALFLLPLPYALTGIPHLGVRGRRCHGRGLLLVAVATAALPGRGGGAHRDLGSVSIFSGIAIGVALFTVAIHRRWGTALAVFVLTRLLAVFLLTRPEAFSIGEKSSFWFASEPRHRDQRGDAGVGDVRAGPPPVGAVPA